ncbi:hypothetical protein LNKW23_27770 [Paralimibaculum aggregatum]|uniref:Sulphotransferase Stf0 domain-containing protein n=1 Tax=Paralimibaculum aggregatum TaxID=3036245 RepID=A0ABQ6LQZ9_9RHOB|nr:Stf0 family sulfotransferase [Limibaculum sp. NKW23]GMG83564.1 hypothetical protein LNKW23_27770 [Limibaculum sp. NKW23]
MTSTIILATQRTGSTLLCSEFSAMGGLGKPGEHFLPWLRAAAGGARLPRPEFEAIAERGRGRAGTVGVKLMADYLPKLARAWLPPDAVPEADDVAASAAMLLALEAEWGPAAIFRIDRADRFDQALSRHLATATGIYFRTASGEERRDERAGTLSQEAALETFTPQRLEQILQDIALETDFLDRVCARLARPVCVVEYEALASRREAVLAACCAHAGVPEPGRWPERWMTKVVDRGQRDRFRARAEAAWAERRATGLRLPETTRIFAPRPAGAAAAAS